MKKTKLYLILSLIANLSIVIMEFFALNHHYVSGDGWELFKMYTQNSNIWLFLCSTLYVIFAIIALCRNSSTPKFVKILRYISTCSITLTFVLIYCYVLGITNFNETNSLFKWPMLAMHTVCPILSIISFVWFEEKFSVSFAHTFIAIIPTSIYAITLTILNICKVVEGPYFFFKVYNQPVFVSVIWFFIIMMSAYSFCLIYKFIYNSLLKRKK